jgi:hypothetical protein
MHPNQNWFPTSQGEGKLEAIQQKLWIIERLSEVATALDRD